MENKRHFPIFIDSAEKKVIVFGGGKIAARRVLTLAEFGFEITVVAPEISEEITALSSVKCITDSFDPKFIKDQYMVLACTDNREINKLIALEAGAKNIYVNVCDRKEECDFFFPAIITTKDVTIGIVGEGNNHAATKQTADKVRDIFLRKGDE